MAQQVVPEPSTRHEARGIMARRAVPGRPDCYWAVPSRAGLLAIYMLGERYFFLSHCNVDKFILLPKLVKESGLPGMTEL